LTATVPLLTGQIRLKRSGSMPAVMKTAGKSVLAPAKAIVHFLRQSRRARKDKGTTPYQPG